MFPERIKVVEVGPRDGLQNEARTLPVTVRTELIDRLTLCGFETIEAGSLVSPKAVPQLADSEAVYRLIRQQNGVEYPLLVGNLQGLDRAIGAGARTISVFCAATETFSLRNNRRSIEQNLDQIRAICERARDHAMRVRGYISCALGCPYEGKVAGTFVATIAARLIDSGCYEVSLADTIGIGTAGDVSRLLEIIAKKVPPEKTAVHFHDTYGQALANVLIAMQSGITVIDSAVAGLGGCPFAGLASGNLASEDLVYLLAGLGIDSGIDFQQLLETGWFIAKLLGRLPESRVSRAIAQKTSPEFSASLRV
ncbi:MAG: hydroxymethylglutaryl-CoA lyase [Gammaproteobacteria bacterium]